MGELKHYKSNDSTVALRPGGNPDGKGLNGFMLDWYRSEPRDLTAKPRRQVLAEFFTSMLVLSAKFKYKPAVGVLNFLYLVDNEWVLSLIAPDEWSDERQAGFVGSCILQHDMTWTIAPSDLLAGDNPVSAAVGRFYDAFAETLDGDFTLEDILPFYAKKMCYYQRLYASALSRSIRGSVVLSGQTSMSCRDWRTCLPSLNGGLLSCNGASA